MEIRSHSTQTSTPYVGSLLPPEMSKGDEEENPPHRTLSKWRRQGGGDEPIVLEHDHPLMKRFQVSLKNHLERQNTRLAEEVLNLDSGKKLKQKEREELGNMLFSTENEVTRQNNALADFRSQLSTLLIMQQELDSAVQETKQEHSSEEEKLNAANKTAMQLRSEVAALTDVERQIKAFTEEAESELAVSQRVSEKTRTEQKQMAEEKKKQDMFVYRLSLQVSSLEERLVSQAGHFRSKEEQRDELCQTLADANTDLEVLNREQLRLLQAWNNVVIATNHRDKRYAAVQAELNDVRQSLVTTGYDMDSVRRGTSKEQERNEELTVRAHRISTQVSDVERAARLLGERRDLLEQQLAACGMALDQTEAEAQRIKNEILHAETEGRMAQRDLEKWCAKKLALEDAILTDMQDQLTGTQAVCHMSKLIKKLRDKTRQQELTMVESENKLAAAMLDSEQLSGENNGNRQLLDELKAEMQEAEKTLQKHQLTLKQLFVGANSRNGMLSVLARRLQILQHRAGGTEMSPMELKIVNLERTIQETVAKSEKLQQYWLRQEGLTVALSQQRNQQLQDLNMIRRQVLILEQRRLKVQQGIDEQGTLERQLGRSVEKLLHRLVAINERLHKTRGSQEALDHENRITHSHYASLLKDEELATLRLEESIREGEAEKAALALRLMTVQREALGWTTRCQLANETRDAFRKETRPDGDMGAMKSEIHRMQVRYGQLRQAQDKLVADLEHCVARRDHIVDQAAAKEKSSKRAPINRTGFGRQLEDLRGKINTAYMKAEGVDQDMSMLLEKQQELKTQLADRQNQLRGLQETASQVDLQMEDALLHKQKNLQLLLRKQRKAGQYADMKVFRHRPLFKNPSKLAAETAKQRSINCDLVSVVEALLEDFPDVRFAITKILNTLRLPAS